MFSLIVTVIVLGLLYWVVSLIPLPPPFPTVVKVLFIIILVFILLGALGVSSNISPVGIKVW